MPDQEPCWCPRCNASVETMTRALAEQGSTTHAVRGRAKTFCKICLNPIKDTGAHTRTDYLRRRSRLRAFVLFMLFSPIMTWIVHIFLVASTNFAYHVFFVDRGAEKSGGILLGLMTVLTFFGVPGLWGLLVRSKLLDKDADLVSRTTAFFCPPIWYLVVRTGLDLLARVSPELSDLLRTL